MARTDISLRHNAFVALRGGPYHWPPGVKHSFSPSEVRMATSKQARRAAIGGLCALAIAMGIGRFAYTPLLPWMQADGLFDAEGAGFIASANLVGYLVGALALARFADRWSPVALLRGGLLLSIATGAGMALTDSFAAWAVLRFLSGLASAGVLIAATGLVLAAAAAAARPGLAGWHFSGVGLGIILSGLVGALLVPDWGWRSGWLVLAALSLPLSLASWRWLDLGAVVGRPQRAAAPATQRFPVLFLVVAYFCEGAGYIITGTFLVALVKALPDLAGAGEYFWIAVGLAAAPSTMLWSAIGRRLGLLPALVLAHLLQAIGIALPVVSAGAPAVLASALLLGATFMGITALTLSLGSAIAGASQARIIGSLTAGFSVGQALGPALGGALAARTGSFDLSLVVAAVIVVAGAGSLLLGRLWERRPAAPAEEKPQ
jgi:predicted MFS family arabinose efflux permease